VREPTGEAIWLMDSTVFDAAGAALATVGFMLTINPPHMVQTATAITPIANSRILRPRRIA